MTPYFHAAMTTATTMPGIESAVKRTKVDAACALLGAGSDQMKSNVPSTFCWLTPVGTITSPSGINARVGVPVTMNSAIVGVTTG